MEGWDILQVNIFYFGNLTHFHQPSMLGTYSHMEPKCSLLQMNLIPPDRVGVQHLGTTTLTNSSAQAPAD